MIKQWVLFLFVISFALPVHSQETSWQQIENVLGKKGIAKGNMFKVVYPRTDLDVRIGKVQVDPRMGLTSWIAFARNTRALVMGDLVLKVGEVMPVMKRMSAEKISVTALHNHLMGTSVQLMDLHFEAEGDAVKLAQSLKTVLAETGTPVTGRPSRPEAFPTELSVVQYFLGPGRQQGSILRYEYPRNQTIIEDDRDLPGFLGTATVLDFSAVGGNVAATGDFVLTAGEVDPVIQTLTDSNITVTALHGDTLEETPRLFFLHFWTVDAPEAVSKGLKDALERINIRKGSQ